MRHRLENNEKIDLSSKNHVLVDTCFLLREIEKGRENQLLKLDFVMTSFNLEELMYVVKHIDHSLKAKIRHFLGRKRFKILELPIHPGNIEHEREFVNSVDPKLLSLVHDPSDAVLLAAAITTRSNILTKDKHHLFTQNLKNYISKYEISVGKEIKDFF